MKNERVDAKNEKEVHRIHDDGESSHNEFEISDDEHRRSRGKFPGRDPLTPKPVPDAGAAGK